MFDLRQTIDSAFALSQRDAENARDPKLREALNTVTMKLAEARRLLTTIEDRKPSQEELEEWLERR